MGSMPNQSFSWFQSRSTQGESSSAAQQLPSGAVSPSTNTDERSVIIISQLLTASSQSMSQEESTAPAASNPSSAPPPREVRTCWICQQDDTEDTPENNVWRSPCPCSLTAHDTCLLDWVASEETVKPNHKIKCPQCQAEINVQGPKDCIVSAIDGIERVLRNLMLPAAASAVVGCIYSALIVYGTNAMALVLGRDEARHILGQGFALTGHMFGTGLSYYAWPTVMDLNLNLIRIMSQLMDPFFPTTFSPSWLVIPPLVAPTLLLLRSKSKLADRVLLTALPFYIMQPRSRNFSMWPPSLGLTLATIPYLARGYNELYDYTFAEHVKKWNVAAQRQPREGETAEQIAAAAEGEEEAILEVEWVEEEVMNGGEGDLIDFNAEEVAPNAGFPAAETNENPQPNIEGEPQVRPPPAVDGAENEGVGPQPNPPRANGNGANGHAGHNHVGFEADINLRGVASAALATLFFPAVCSVMGDLIKVLLPTAMTVPAGSPIRGTFLRSPEYAQRGLLRGKWGRSIVGGCLFVVLKDAVVLYCKWKKARDFGKRKVLDYVGNRGRRA